MFGVVRVPVAIIYFAFLCGGSLLNPKGCDTKLSIATGARTTPNIEICPLTKAAPLKTPKERIQGGQ